MIELENKYDFREISTGVLIKTYNINYRQEIKRQTDEEENNDVWKTVEQIQQNTYKRKTNNTIPVARISRKRN